MQVDTLVISGLPCFAACLMASILATAALASEESDRPWYERVVVGMEIGPTGAQFGHSDPQDARYCRLWDGREIVQRAVDAHSEYLVLWARDGDYAYYSSTLLPKAPGLGQRDPLKDAVDEAAHHKLPLIAYCVVQQGGHFLKAHPEWEMRGSDGSPIGRFCYNSGYLEAMKEIVSELLAYGIAGLHVDMMDQGFGPPYGCWCDACQKQFEAAYGHKMPQGATWDQDWDDMLEFRYSTSERFEKELTAHIRATYPQAMVDYNYHGSPPFSFEVGQRPVQHADNGDFVTGETGVWGFSALGVGLNAEFYRASTPGHPFQVAIQRGVRMYHDQTTRPLNDMRWELLTLLAHGAFVTMVDKTGFDGWMDPVAYERIGKVQKEARDKRSHFGQAPVYDIGLYFSSRTRDWIGREKVSRYFSSFTGAHQVCAMEHLQYGVLLDENVTLQRLQQFPVVCLPNVGILSDSEASLFRLYVEQGGNLFITGQTGQFDRLGQPVPVKDSILAELIGAQVQGRLESLDNWVRLGDSGSTKLSQDLESNWPFLVEGPATVYEPTTATPVGELMRPFRTTRQMQGQEWTEWPMSADSPVGPAFLVNQVGQGTVLTCAASPCSASAGEHAMVEDRILFRNAVRELSPASRVSVTAPSTVETVVTEDADAKILRVHCIAYSPTPRTTPASNRPFVLPGLIEDAPIYRITLELSERPKRVEALNPTTQIHQKARQVNATIEDIHETLIVRY